MNAEMKLITKSPFVKESDSEGGVFWSIELEDPATNRIVGASISPYALLHSLGEERGEQELFTCGCGVAECAGFYHERFKCTEKYVNWSLEEMGIAYSLFFDRVVYEIGAIEMLHDIYVTKAGWDFNSCEYCSYEEFKAEVDEFLAAKPHFKVIWDRFKESNQA